jgi:flagellar hook-associated protein 2
MGRYIMPDLGHINVSDIVTRSMKREQIKVNRLENSKKLEKTHLDTYANITSVIQNFSKQLKTLNTALVAGNQASSSNTTIATAVITGNASQGSHSLSITQLAQANTIASVVSWPDTTTTTMGAAETLSFSQGTTNFTVPVSATDTLQTVCNNINNATGNTDITASIVSTAPNTYTLLISSTLTGSANQITISGDTSNIFNLTNVLVPAQDAKFSFDNLNITRPTNAVSDVIDGLTFNLLTAPTTTPVTLTIAANVQQNQSIKTAVQDVITSYNQILATIDKNQADRDTRDQGLPGIRLVLENAILSTLGVSGQYTTLESIGILHAPPSQQKIIKTVLDENGKEVKREITYTLRGQLQLNTNPHMPTLDDALANNLTDLQTFFNDPNNGLITLLQDNTIKSLLEPDNEQIIFRRNQDFNAKIRGLDNKIAAEESRLMMVQETLYTKYTKLNNLLSKFDQTQHFLEQQLSSLKMYERG